MRFVEVAGRVEGAPQLDPTQLQDDDATDADAVAAYRLKSNVNGVGKLLAGGAGARRRAQQWAALPPTERSLQLLLSGPRLPVLRSQDSPVSQRPTPHLPCSAGGLWQPVVLGSPAAPWC